MQSVGSWASGSQLQQSNLPMPRRLVQTSQDDLVTRKAMLSRTPDSKPHAGHLARTFGKLGKRLSVLRMFELE